MGAAAQGDLLTWRPVKVHLEVQCVSGRYVHRPWLVVANSTSQCVASTDSGWWRQIDLAAASNKQQQNDAGRAAARCST